MQERRHFTQIQPLEDRLVEHATRLREEAKVLPPGIVREAILRRAEQAETGAHMSQWLRLPGPDLRRHSDPFKRPVGCEATSSGQSFRPRWRAQ